MSKGRADRRWRTFSKYVSRIKKRLYFMKIQYDEIDVTTPDGLKYKKKLWRKPESWKEADSENSAGSKLLKETPTPYKEPWKKVDDTRHIKDIREESRKIIDEELNNIIGNGNL